MAADIGVTIGGNDAGLKAAFASAQASANKFAVGMQRDFDGIMARVGKLQTAFVGLGSAILAGGAFKQATDESVRLTREATALGRALGITTSEASILNVALGDIFITSEVVVSANAKLTQTLTRNEGAFRAIGVATRDSNGNLRNSLDIMLDVNRHLLSMREGTDRNVEGTRLYGKAWSDVQPTLKLTTELMDSSREKAKALGLVVGEENVAAVQKFRSSMSDVGDVMTATQKVIGDAVLPELTKLGDWFSSTGPDKVSYTRKAIYSVVAAFYVMKSGVETVFLAVRGILEESIRQWIVFADVMGRALRFDFGGALEVFNREMPNGVFGGWMSAASKTFGQITDAAVEANKNIMGALDKGFGAGVKTTPTKARTGGNTSVESAESKGAAPSRMGEFENTLDRMKLAHEKQNAESGTFIEFQKSRERDYWKSVLAMQDLSAQERMSVERKYVAVVQSIRKDEYDALVVKLKTEMDAYTQNMDARIAIARRIEAETAGRFGKDSKEAQAAAGEIVQIEKRKAEQLANIERQRIDSTRADRLLEIELLERDAELARALGVLRETDLLRIKREFMQRRLQLELEANQAEIDAAQGNPDKDPVALEKLEQQKLEIKRRFKLAERDNDNQQTAEKQKPFDGLFGGVEQSFELVTNGILGKVKNFGQQFRQIWQQTITKFATDQIMQLVRQWVLGETVKTQATIASATIRSTTETAAAATSTASTGGSAIANIGAKAWEAAASVYASIAQIPYVGPFLAPAMAIGAAAMVLGFAGKIFSAEGGMSIPKGVNPLIQAHAEEMVLPAQYANVIRSMAEGGGAAGGGGATNVTMNIQAWDSRDVARFLKGEGKALVASMANQRRSFNIRNS